jgi:transposase
MDTFDDLFDRGIPQDVAQEYLSDLQKLAVSLSWVHRAATRGAKEAPTERLLATASRSIRGAQSAASKGNGDVAKKRLLLKNKVLDEALHRGSQKAASLDKEAVSTDWVGRMARSGVQNSTRARTQEVAGRSMKGVLDAVKKKGPNVQAHVDKRMALHQAANSPQRLSVGSVSSMAPSMRKAAESLKEAVSTEFVGRVARAAAQKASPQRAQEVAGSSMKKVLEAAKRKGPNTQAHVDKRMALRQGVLAGGSTHPPAFRKAASGLGLKLAAAVKSLVQAANEPPPEAVIMQEQQGQLQQALAENAELHHALEESQGLIQEHAQAVQQAGEMAQQTQEQLQEAEMAGQEAQMQAQEQLAMAQQQAQMAQAEAQTQAAEAASQADGKMRLAIRIQQIRQQLADMASQDIVAEEGEQAEPLLTPGQQGMGDPNAPQDPSMAGQDPAAAQGAPPGGPPGAEAAPPAAGGGQAAPAAEKPKPKPKKKSEDKGESKAGPKTEIKIGSATVHQLGDVAKARGVLGRAKQLMTGSRARRLDEMFTAAHAKHKDAPRNSAQSARVYRLGDQAMRERAKSVGTQGAAVGTAYLGGKAVHGSLKEKKASGVPRIPKGAGMARAKELLLGTRMKALDKARDAGEYGSEARKVLATQLGATTAGAGAVGAAGAGAHRHLKKDDDQRKVATEEQVRADARRAAGRTGALQGGAILGTLARLRGHSGGGTAVRAAIGGLIGRQHGTAGFDKRELANDLHMERALTKSKRDRTDKALEKGAAPVQLGKAKGIRRFGELLSGSRADRLVDAADHARRRAKNIPEGTKLPKRYEARHAAESAARGKDYSDKADQLKGIGLRPDHETKIRAGLDEAKRDSDETALRSLHRDRSTNALKGQLRRSGDLNVEAMNEADAVTSTRKATVRGVGSAMLGTALYKHLKPHKGGPQKNASAGLSDTQIDRLYGLEAAQ